MTQRSHIVTFSLTSAQPRAWLVINKDHKAPQVVEMCRQYANYWSASVWLTPGDYQCCYYCGDDKHVTYAGPALLNGPARRGNDGLISVAVLHAKTYESAMTILIVEDNLVSLHAMEKFLQSEGHTVHTAEGYQTAMDVARKQQLQLAICDINLWDGDGCELLIEMQKLQPLKAIAVTGYTLPDETETYRAAGFVAVLRKPVHPSEITAAINSLNAVPPVDLSAQTNQPTFPYAAPNDQGYSA